jgi:hypothetical protein
MSKLRLITLTAAACLAATTLPAAVAPASASSLVFTGIHPGALLFLDGGGSCTANFVFQTPDGAFDPTQDLYIGTAGHCADLGDTIQALVVPPTLSTAQITHEIPVTVGTVVVDGMPDNGSSDHSSDFALIKVDAAVRSWVSPSMAWWGGPTGIYTGGAGPVVNWTGNGGVAGGVLPRVGVLKAVTASGIMVDPTVAASGDSGSPVETSDHLAVGSVVAVENVLPPVGSFLPGGLDVLAGTVAYGPTIARMIELAGHPLATCPTATPWPRPGCPTV